MSAPDTTTMSLEQKILVASRQAEQVIAVFSPQLAGLVEAGVEVEPVISGFARLIAGIFHHHTGVTPTPTK